MSEPTSSQHGPTASRLSPQEREAFLRRQGWSLEMPQAQRETIEVQWPDGAIEEALLLGF